MAEPFDLTDVLEIKYADDDNKLYIMGIKSTVTPPDDDDDDDNTEDDPTPEDPTLERLKTVVLDGTEEYIRYYDGEILIKRKDTACPSQVWSPDPVTKTPMFARKLEAIRKFLKDNGKEL